VTGVQTCALPIFFWDGATILLYSQPDTPKLRNVAAHPGVAFTLNTDAYGDHVLIIEGTAAVDATAPAWDANEAFSAKFSEAVVHWGIGDVHEVARDFSVAVRINPTRIRAW
jgi:PPOX class probable F420-dependent enzyme